jgi:hypothetical protein
VHQEEGRITLSQRAYATRIVDKAGLADCNTCVTPMEPRLKLSRNSTTPEVDATQYRSLVGSIRYLVNTRPNLAFSIGYVARFMERPTEEHLGAVKHIIRYVPRTTHLGCQYSRDDHLRLAGLCDSDLTGDTDTSKSTSDVAFFLGESAEGGSSLHL